MNPDNSTKHTTNKIILKTSSLSMNDLNANPQV